MKRISRLIVFSTHTGEGELIMNDLEQSQIKMFCAIFVLALAVMILLAVVSALA